MIQGEDPAKAYEDRTLRVEVPLQGYDVTIHDMRLDRKLLRVLEDFSLATGRPFSRGRFAGKDVCEAPPATT